MPLHPTLADITFRLLLTLAAGLLIGFDRGERGHAAGLRTTALVCLAASVAMIQMNLLLPVAGKEADSFSVMDVMRLPLGILSGMGFIGAGAILRKGDAVSGVTTAATLWLVTVIGLCFGGGQLWLGAATTALALIVLALLKQVDQRIARERKVLLSITLALDTEIESDLRRTLSQAHIHSDFVDGCYDRAEATKQVTYEIRWHARSGAREPRELLQPLLDLPGVRALHWSATP